MSAWQNADLDIDLADLVEGATVRTNAVVEHLVAEDVFADQFKGLAEALGGGGVIGGKRLLCSVLDLFDLRVGGGFVVLLGIDRIGELVFYLTAELVVVGRGVFRRGKGALGPYRRPWRTR